MSDFDVVQFITGHADPGSTVASTLAITLTLPSALTPGNILLLVVAENSFGSTNDLPTVGTYSGGETIDSGVGANAQFSQRTIVTGDSHVVHITAASTGEDIVAFLMELAAPAANAGDYYVSFQFPETFSAATAVTADALDIADNCTTEGAFTFVLASGIPTALSGIAVDSGYTVVGSAQSSASSTALAIIVSHKNFTGSDADTGTPATSWTHAADTAIALTVGINNNGYTGGWRFGPNFPPNAGVFSGNTFIFADAGAYTKAWPPEPPGASSLSLNANLLAYIVAVPNPAGGPPDTNLDHSYPTCFYFGYVAWDSGPGSSTTAGGAVFTQDGGTDTGSIPTGAHLYIVWQDLGPFSNPDVIQPDRAPSTLLPVLSGGSGYNFNRIPWDRDGTLLYTVSSGTATLRDSGEPQQLNSEGTDQTSNTDRVKDWVWIFPTKRSLQAVYVLTDSTGPTQFSLFGSNNTTDGSDGVWADLGRYSLSTGDAGDFHKNPNINTLGDAARLQSYLAYKMTGIDATDSSAGITQIHLFGNIVNDYADGLVLWHPTQDVQIDPDKFFYGAVNQGSSSAPIRFRIKNLSRVLVAVGVVVTFPTSLTPDTIDQAHQHFVRTDPNGPFTASVSLGDLSPISVSALIELKRVTAVASDTGPWAAWVVATATSWAARQFVIAHT